MCGFAGLIERPEACNAQRLGAAVEAMSAALTHRGPDDHGLWMDPAAGYAVGFRRLSIVDLSPHGHQPMISLSGRWVLAFNGEIYNHLDIRHELAGNHEYRGHSDTETILAAVERWGIEKSLQRFVGMFAMALWDTVTRTLWLARDRFGEKPLYYGWCKERFFFASELKAMETHADFTPALNRQALAPYLLHGYIPAPLSIWDGIFKLSPGHVLELKDAAPGQLPASLPYWSINQAAGPTQDISAPDATERLDQLLRKAVAGQMVADVPLGAFLSGGVDSSTIVALMQAQSSAAVKTFTIGFSESGFDEAGYAAAVARHIGTDHTELYVSAAQARQVIGRLPTIFDEPFADSTQIPNFLVAQLAARHVTVSLSGDGGDELFAGYDWYARSATWHRRFSKIPSGCQRAAGAVLRTFAGAVVGGNAGRKTRRLGNLLMLGGNLLNQHRCLLSSWDGGDVPLPRRLRWPSAMEADPAGDGDPIRRLQCCDINTYLPDDILVKVDRTAMAVSLETRAPLLDHRVAEFALSLPPALNIAGGKGKQILRRVLDRYVPRQLIERPKKGFDVPIGAWLRNELRDWAENLLDAKRLGQQGVFDPAPIGARWREHLSGRRDNQNELWPVLMFQAWLEARPHAAAREQA